MIRNVLSYWFLPGLWYKLDILIEYVVLFTFVFISAGSCSIDVSVIKKKKKLSTVLQVEEDEKLKKRKERFGILTSAASAGAEDSEVQKVLFSCSSSVTCCCQKRCPTDFQVIKHCWEAFKISERNVQMCWTSGGRHGIAIFWKCPSDCFICETRKEISTCFNTQVYWCTRSPDLHVVSHFRQRNGNEPKDLEMFDL